MPRTCCASSAFLTELSGPQFLNLENKAVDGLNSNLCSIFISLRF